MSIKSCSIKVNVILDKASFAVFSGVSVTHDKLVDTVDENHRLKVATLKALKDMRDSCFGPNLAPLIDY